MEDRLHLTIEDSIPPVIRATGELDYENCEGLDSVIRSTFKKCDSSLHLALDELDFVDSSGLRILVKAALDGQKMGCSLSIVSMTPYLDKMLSISGFKHLFMITDPPTTVQAPVSTAVETPEPYSFKLEATKSACREARDNVYAFAEKMGFDILALDDIKLAIGEAISNAVRHGASDCDYIEVQCRDDSGRLIVTIKYPSKTFDPESIPIPNSETAAEGGMGIYFMKIVMDRVHYDFSDGSATLTLEKQLPR